MANNVGGPLPDSVIVYKRTPSFDERTIPAGLRKDHTTKAGTWGRIRVEHGKLRYVVPGRDIDAVLDAETTGVIAPEELHRVEPVGAVSFYVEFLSVEAFD